MVVTKLKRSPFHFHGEVGLRSLVQQQHSRSSPPQPPKSNTILQASSALLFFRTHNKGKINGEEMYNSNYCYLRWCCLCKGELSLEKEVYMYRGDQGFCSIECRDRQIYLDEMKELRERPSYSSSSSISSHHHHQHRLCAADQRRNTETRLLLEELRQRRLNWTTTC